MPKRILIVRKLTNFELHGARVERNIVRGSWHEEDLARLRHVHSQHYAFLDQLYKFLDAKKVEFQSVERDQDWAHLVKDVDAVIAFGGDGTLLSASHHLPHGARLIGLRSMDAGVGYMCAAGAPHFERVLDEFLADRLLFVDVARMQVQVEQLERTIVSDVPVLNDILYANVHPAATTCYQLSFRGQQELHKSSGIWIATAVGSTAAIQAAGGLRLAIDDRRFQFRVRELYNTPNAYAQLLGDPFDCDKELFEIENRNEKAFLALDGQHAIINLEFGDRISLRRAGSLSLALPEYAQRQS